jgi:PhnB protein
MPDRAWTLSQIEEALGGLPRPEFRARLRSDLERTAAMTSAMTQTSPADAGDRVRVRQTASPLLRVRDAARAIEFYTRAFGAREVMRFEAGGRIPHAQLAVGNATILLGDEAPEHGYPSPDQLGGSPITIRLDVDDPDAAVERAVAAGARLVMPVADQFYGERTGQVVDPFGYRWALTKVTEEMSVDEMHRRMAAMMGGGAPDARAAKSAIREGFRTVTPYVVVPDAEALIGFVRAAFGAEETARMSGGAGGIHAEVRIGDSMLMIGGGRADRPGESAHWVTAFHVYVPDADATYARALAEGAVSLQPPADQPYGERIAGVKDASGNLWYIATFQGAQHVPPDKHALSVYLHPFRAEPVITFMQRAFGATEIEKHATRDGVIAHARVKVGDSMIEMGEAHGPYQPMPTRFYLYVQNADAAYERALAAGATSAAEPANQPYGERTAAVADPFGNEWYLATPIRADKV